MKKGEKMLDAKLERDMAGPHALSHKAFAFIYNQPQTRAMHGKAIEMTHIIVFALIYSK